MLEDKIKQLRHLIPLQKRRVAKVKEAATKKPDWNYFNRMIQEVIPIQTLVEENEAVLEYYQEELKKTQERLTKLRSPEHKKYLAKLEERRKRREEEKSARPTPSLTHRPPKPTKIHKGEAVWHKPYFYTFKGKKITVKGHWEHPFG